MTSNASWKRSASFLLCFLCCRCSAGAADTITTSTPLRSNSTITSPLGVFELGFFTVNGSTGSPSCYVGIWYRSVPSSPVVWVLNRDDPIAGTTGVLSVTDDGRLVLFDQSERRIWSSPGNHSQSMPPAAQLLDSGNFVLKPQGNGGIYLWQSFDYPTDSLLPGMKLGVDLRTGLSRSLRSWKTPEDPSSGDYTFRMDPRGLPEVFLWNGAARVYRSGPWNGVGFSGVPEMRPSSVMNFTFTVSREEVFYSFEVLDRTIISRLVVNYTGLLQRFTWIPDRRRWVVFWYAPKDQCDGWRECGTYGVCDTNDSPVCTCPQGFRPANPEAWALRDGSGGCRRRTAIGCGAAGASGFAALRGMKVPDTTAAFADRAMGLAECGALCRGNCSCTAYANSEVAGGGSGCVMWTGNLSDMRRYAEGRQVLYVRVAASDLAMEGGKNGSSSRRHNTVMVIAAIAGVMIIGLGICALWKRKKLRMIWEQTTTVKGSRERTQSLILTDGVMATSKRDCSDDSKSREFELPLFDLETVMSATNNFSETNKLGQGGFGTVYKGMLMEGQEIAVKRLSKNSGQGIEEFKNEVRLIARLQHRNLVRLLGCCVVAEEKMVIYEYMQHKSLDSIVFNKEKSSLLDWTRRFSIISGIARGLLYLHQDSRYRIIHRDLKASNVLLDGNLNPKISDFGMARIFGGDQTEANTSKVVGTYGYMSPEYAMDGIFSVKSDVFSFGVLVLEIISGKKNRGFYYSDSQHNLLGHAWGLWREGKGIGLMDPSVGESYSVYELLRCLQVGLLCVQERAEDRPTMASVVLMLGSETAALPQPKTPGFCMGRNPGETDSSSSKPDETCTVNQVTVTVLDPR